ncbi:hypothetical protein [Streptomyces carpinensis]|uniref:Uncharacterized protein n=1 Tax=Streptomyces carpinensis TaxID=66369 RepID=A0ABV1W319_9ACTN|nr:hypothetical protein [Streptomyces carpinensis]
MIYDLLLAGTPVSPPALADALIQAVGVGDVDVDVADRDDDQSARDWTAPVLCGYGRLLGDLSMSLDIYVLDALFEEETAPSESEFAARLAAALGVAVLYPAVEDIPSAYWVVGPSGETARARLLSSDGEPPVHTIDAVESAVAELPGAAVETLPEILDGEAIGTPVADAALAGRPTGTTASVEGHVHYDLRVWERLVRRLESGWAPSGRYREDLFRRDLEARDDLAVIAGRVDQPFADALRSAVALLDSVFREYTEEAADPHSAPDRTDTTADHWWWRRRPRNVPW